MNSTPPYADSRDSNVELLRIICMLMIVTNHLLGPMVGSNHAFDVPIVRVLHCFLYVAVNCFVLISGYYGIKLKLQSIFNLYIICAFYSLMGYMIHIIVDDASIGKSLIYNTIFVFSHNTWWFIHAYVGLMLLSPLLNVAISALDNKTYLFCIGLLLISNFYFGWFWHTDLFTSDGFAISQFVLMYLIGGYIHKYKPIEHFDKNRKNYLLLYVIMVFTYGLLQELHLHFHWSNLDFTDNNSLFAILAAIGLFGFMLSFHFRNKFINNVAKSSLAVYLIHCQAYISIILFTWMNKLYLHIDSINGILTPYLELFLAIVLGVCIFVVSISIDKIRMLIMKPLWYLYGKCEKLLIPFVVGNISKFYKFSKTA